MASNADIPLWIRQQVLDRDNSQCVVCGTSGDNRLHLHHVIYRSQGGTHTVDNLATVCHRDHDRIHAGDISIVLIQTAVGPFFFTIRHRGSSESESR